MKEIATTINETYEKHLTWNQMSIGSWNYHNGIFTILINTDIRQSRRESAIDNQTIPRHMISIQCIQNDLSIVVISNGRNKW